jgi:hypothetical protein
MQPSNKSFGLHSTKRHQRDFHYIYDVYYYYIDTFIYLKGPTYLKGMYSIISKRVAAPIPKGYLISPKGAAAPILKVKIWEWLHLL